MYAVAVSVSHCHPWYPVAGLSGVVVVVVVIAIFVGAGVGTGIGIGVGAGVGVGSSSSITGSRLGIAPFSQNSDARRPQCFGPEL